MLDHQIRLRLGHLRSDSSHLSFIKVTVFGGLFQLLVKLADSLHDRINSLTL